MKTVAAEGISKRYRIGEYKAGYQTLRDTLAHGVRRALRLEHVDHSLEELWALKDVTFAIDEGEVVGFIGRNGSGKSTLLKILTRITPPTEGSAWIRGRVGSILEVGTGFHPELTGRENTYLNGAVLGMNRYSGPLALLSSVDQPPFPRVAPMLHDTWWLPADQLGSEIVL